MKTKHDSIKQSVTRRGFLKSSGLFASGLCLSGLSPAFSVTETESFNNYRNLSKRSSLRLSVFRADVTPPVGSPLCGGLVKPVAGVTEPLLALGIVILGAGKPIVLCAVDWCEIHNSDHVLWREQLAAAAGTTPERVSVHSLHQHNAPIADTQANKILAESVNPVPVYDTNWGFSAIKNTAESVKVAMKRTQRVTHYSFGEAEVSQVASNRRVMGEDGKVAFTRTSSTKDPKVRAMPEGTIDPMLKTVSFWSGSKKIVTLHYYTTHPMSYYGDGMVTSDFAGIAREKRTQEEGIPHIYFTGCSGNITAGKYNDGDKANRLLLADRIHSAMVKSELSEKRISMRRVEWRSKPMLMRAHPDYTEDQMMRIVMDAKKGTSERIGAAMRISFIRHSVAGIPVQMTSLHLNDNLCLLHLPAEAFVEYQLFAQQQFSEKFIATAAYADTGAVYIPLVKSFAEGGYEPTWAYADPSTEIMMKNIIVELLRDN
jgi:hypothetical protein